jgi:RNA polymerase sigma-70 factor (ECF subfamily)
MEDYSAPLQKYLEHMVGKPAIAEELLQETLVRIAAGLDNFAGRSSLKTWVFRIATNVAVDYFRRPEYRNRFMEVEEVKYENTVAQIPDQTMNVDERLVIDDMNVCIREVVDSLPTDYSAALVLHDFEGLTAAAIAEILSCSLASVKIRIHRARKQLGSALEFECSFYQDAESVLRCDRKQSVPEAVSELQLSEKKCRIS